MYNSMSSTLVPPLGIEPRTYALSRRCSTTELWRQIVGGSGEIRTHGPISEPTVFKTVAINRTLPSFDVLLIKILWGETGNRTLDPMFTASCVATTLESP